MGVEIFGLSVEVWIESKEEEEREEKKKKMMMMKTDRWFISMNVCTYA